MAEREHSTAGYAQQSNRPTPGRNLTIQLIGPTGALCEPYRHKSAIRAAHRRHDFSGEPAEVGWKPGRVAQAWAELMHRLGYTRYVGQAAAVGASVTELVMTLGGAPGRSCAAGQHT